MRAVERRVDSDVHKWNAGCGGAFPAIPAEIVRLCTKRKFSLFSWNAAEACRWAEFYLPNEKRQGHRMFVKGRSGLLYPAEHAGIFLFGRAGQGADRRWTNGPPHIRTALAISSFSVRCSLLGVRRYFFPKNSSQSTPISVRFPFFRGPLPRQGDLRCSLKSPFSGFTNIGSASIMTPYILVAADDLPSPLDPTSHRQPILSSAASRPVEPTQVTDLDSILYARFRCP